MQRLPPQASIDLLPVMAVMALLIAMLVMNQQESGRATIDVDLPRCGCGHHDGVLLTPEVLVTLDGIQVRATGEPEVAFDHDDLDGVTEHLAGLRDRHQTSDEAVIVPAGRVTYERMVAVLDATRPHFPVATLAGGVD